MISPKKKASTVSGCLHPIGQKITFCQIPNYNYRGTNTHFDTINYHHIDNEIQEALAFGSQ